MKTNGTWKPVTIGGFTGILIGAGAMHASQGLGRNDAIVATDRVEQLKEFVADEALTFREAFDAARAELGPGGVFRWHGDLYNTYTVNEWEAMKKEEQDTFVEELDLEVSANKVVTSDLAEEVVLTSDDESVTVKVVADTDKDVSIVSSSTKVQTDDASDDSIDEEDEDVRVIGYGDIDLANGNSVTVEELEINGQRVAVIDLDKDGVGDIAMSDLNHNNRADDGEIIDLHTGDVLSFENHASVDDVDSVIDIMPA